MDQPILRSVRSSEIAELIAFWVRSGENSGRPPDNPAAVAALLERDPQALIIAELDGRIVATIIAGWDGWRANLYRLAVDPDLRGHGLGRRVLDAAEERLRTLGARRFCAMVLDDNRSGAEFWALTGYVPQDDWRQWVKPAD